MRNLIPINCDPLDIFRRIVAQKQEGRSRILSTMYPVVNSEYAIYLNDFDRLTEHSPSSISSIQKEAMLHCYEGETKPLEILKKEIKFNQSPEMQNTCPYCLITTPDTFDHYVPKEYYPLFSVLPQNLLPCCSRCNGKKLQYWKDNNFRKIIHFYNDLLPIVQYLFVDLSFDESVPVVEFYTSFDNSISHSIRDIIEGHFERLALCSRYKGEVNKAISDFVTTVRSIRSVMPSISLTQIQLTMNEKADRDMEIYGVNYWKSVLYKEISSDLTNINLLVQ